MIRSFLYISFTFFLILSYAKAQIQTKKKKEDITTRILFIYDASNSMNGRWDNKPKHESAKELLIQMVDSIDGMKNVQMALRMYGHQHKFPPQVCDDTKLEVPFANKNGTAIKKVLNATQPKGTTPIALTLLESANDFTPCTNCQNIIVLITDGIEECGGDMCATAYALQKKGITLKPFVIGIGLGEFKTKYDCVGNYYDVNNETELKRVLGVVISQALNNTTLQINLLDANGKANETDVNMTFYNHYTKKIEYNFIHTMNYRGVPDTLPVDAAITYDIVVHTIPSVRKDSITLTPGIHNTKAIDTPQGFLHLNIAENSSLKNTKAVISKKGSCETLNIQNMGETEKYLVGNYDLEIQTLPKMNIKDVRISQSHTTKIEIPEPGVAHIITDVPGIGSIVIEKNGSLEWVCNLPDNVTKKSIELLPGNYRVVFRSKASKESIFTVERKFEIKSGISSTVNLFK